MISEMSTEKSASEMSTKTDGAGDGKGLNPSIATPPPPKPKSATPPPPKPKSANMEEAMERY